MKVLYVTNMYPVAGNPNQGIFVKEQVDAINRVEPIQYDVFLIQGKAGLGSVGPYLKSIYEIPRVIRQKHYDLVHIHYGLSGLYSLFSHVDIPCVITLHGGDIQIEQGKKVQVALTKHILRHCDLAITLNSKMDAIVSKYIGNTQIIPCGINEDLFKPCEREDPSRQKQVNILFPSSRQRYVKDFPLYESACNIIRNKYNVNVKEYYLEHLSREEVAKLYQSMDLMLMTSISEGSPQVVKEAMATDLPVVSTNVGDVSVLLEGVQNSYVANSRAPQELADLCIKSLFEKQDYILSPSMKIKKMGLDNTSVAKRILSKYHELLGK